MVVAGVSRWGRGCDSNGGYLPLPHAGMPYCLESEVAQQADSEKKQRVVRGDGDWIRKSARGAVLALALTLL
eukprot:15063720-Alexandrium_andersonii.AAC.1